MKIIGFYTRGAYAKEAARLRQSLTRLGLPHHLAEIDPVDDWHLATAHKPKFLLQMRHALNGPLLYIDVDAVVHRDPWGDVLEAAGDADLALRRRNDHLLTGTMYLAPTRRCFMALTHWIEFNAAQQAMGNLAGGGQSNLRHMLMRDDLPDRPKVADLPTRLCHIFDLDADSPQPPVIEHLQASRENKTPLVSSEEQRQRRRRRVAELEATP